MAVQYQMQDVHTIHLRMANNPLFKKIKNSFVFQMAMAFLLIISWFIYQLHRIQITILFWLLGWHKEFYLVTYDEFCDRVRTFVIYGLQRFFYYYDLLVYAFDFFSQFRESPLEVLTNAAQISLNAAHVKIAACLPQSLCNTDWRIDSLISIFYAESQIYQFRIKAQIVMLLRSKVSVKLADQVASIINVNDPVRSNGIPLWLQNKEGGINFARPWIPSSMKIVDCAKKYKYNYADSTIPKKPLQSPNTRIINHQCAHLKPVNQARLIESSARQTSLLGFFRDPFKLQHNGVTCSS